MKKLKKIKNQYNFSINVIVKLLQVIIREYPNFKYQFYISLLLLFFSIIANLITPILYKLVIDNLPSRSLNSIYLLLPLILYSIFWIITYIITPLRDLQSNKMTEYMVSILNKEFFKKFLSSCFKNINSYGKGEVLTIVERMEMGLFSTFSDILFFIFPAIMEILFAGLILCYYYPAKYSLILLSIFIAYSSTVLIFSIRIMRLQEIDYNAKNKSVNLLYDNLKNLALIKYTCQEQKEIMHYNKIEDRRYSFKQKTLNTRFYIALLECSLVGLGTILSIILSIMDIKSGILSFGDFILINVYISQFFSPLKHLGLICLGLQKYITSFDTILKIIETSQSYVLEQALRPLIITNPTIKFQEVYFSYNQNVFALESLTLIIMPKKFTAIVGRSGSGKSTITKLLAKLYDLDNGSITIDGQDIRYVTQQELVKHISITPQESLLFDRTILYNIKYANSNASFRKVCDICKRIGLHDIIMALPNQYNTIFGKADVSLSGGQKQLLCIARALVQDVDIYVFDEVTSNLDSITEEKVLKEIKNILQYKTVIFISHRLTKIKEADHILVMDSGKLVEEGKHKDLLLKNGYYKKLWQDYSNI